MVRCIGHRHIDVARDRAGCAVRRARIDEVAAIADLGIGVLTVAREGDGAHGVDIDVATKRERAGAVLAEQISAIADLGVASLR